MLKKLIWESKFYNKSIYTFELNNLNIELLREKINKNKFSLIQIKINKKKTNIINKLIKIGFKIESISDTYEKKTSGKFNHDYKIASINEYKELTKISNNLFIHSRIKDKYFGKNSANKLYNHWIKRSISGKFDDCCLIISDNQKKINGFVTIKKINNFLKIGLFGIDKYSQFKGYGTKLLQTVNHYMLAKKVKKSIVTTQNDNIPAKKIYLKDGYKLKESNVWLYYKK